MNSGCGTPEPAIVRSAAISRCIVLSLVGRGWAGGLRITIGRPSTRIPTTMFWVPPANGLTSVTSEPISCWRIQFCNVATSSSVSVVSSTGRW